jgi:hypothetical protein
MSYRTGLHPSLDAELELPSPVRSCPHSEIECEPCETDRLDAPYIAQANGRLAMSLLAHQRSQHERKTVTAIFIGGHPQLGEVFVNADRETHFVPRYKAVKVNARSVLLEGVDRSLDILVRINKGKNPKYRFKRVENQ